MLPLTRIPPSEFNPDEFRGSHSVPESLSAISFLSIALTARIPTAWPLGSGTVGGKQGIVKLRSGREIRNGASLMSKDGFGEAIMLL